MTNMMSGFHKDGRNYPTAAQLAAAVDELAELLSQGFTLNESAERMGVSPGTGCVLFRRICEHLGPQAV